MLWLIVACLTLLGLSQVLWIKRVWHEQNVVLRQETNYIFQKTVMALQDSLVRKSMTRNGMPIGHDFPPNGGFYKPPAWAEMPPEISRETKIRFRRDFEDSRSGSDSLGTKQIQVIIATNDSQPMQIQRGLGRLFLNLHQDSLSKKTDDIIFNIQNDTISLAELERSYAAALDSASLPGSFSILVQENPAAFPIAKNLATEPALGGLLRHSFFQAIFQDYRGYLMQKILPYGLFSFFLFGLTSLSFWLIFNNLKQQKKLSQQKNEFISNVSHELKTPLTTVGVALEALHDFEVLRNPEKTKEYLQISKLELERLNLLVDKVLRLSMFEQQALQLHREWLDPAAIAQQVIHAMTLQAKSVGANIQFQADEQPGMVYCDRLHLSGVVYNLLDNALKYRRGTPEIDVLVGKKRHNGQEFVTLKVSDNGQGIVPEYQSQIFEKFFRVPTGDTHNVKGHGLGLSYVAHVMHEHGGSIRVESMPGQGSTFIVEIPAATPPQAA